MITDIQFDGQTWQVTISDKYTGESWFVVFALYKAMWNFIMGSLNR